MQVTMKATRLRTIDQCYEIIKSLDEGTAVTSFFIRDLCKKNEIKYVMAGNKTLVNLESLFEKIGFEIIEEQTEPMAL